MVAERELIIDKEDIPIISIHSWHMNNGYLRSSKVGYLHRFIMNVTDPNIQVDHKNRNTIDNRRSNLRIATPSQQGANKTSSKGVSKYKGVSPSKNNSSLWESNIQFKGKHIYLGSFINEINAAYAYDKKAVELFEDFAVINGIEDNDLIDEPSRFQSKYKGICKERGGWRAEIQVNKVSHYLGNFNNQISAAIAYDNYVISNKLNRKLNFNNYGK